MTIDILIVSNADGTYESTPCCLNFGGKALPGEQVDLSVNGELLKGHDFFLDDDRTVHFSDEEGADRCDLLPRHLLPTLNLVGGNNTLQFRTRTSNKTKEVTALVWNSDVKIVITDIDGTITRSNFRGHLMPRLGYDWHHMSVSTFFQKLHSHGYKIIYVTARSVRMNTTTREYLKSMELPPGPVFSSHKSIGRSLVSELFTGDSKFSKVAHLTDIVRLFPESFVAAFGNNDKDFWTYSQVNIPASHVFIINKESQILANSRKTSYTDLLQEIEDWFPQCGMVNKT